MNIIKEYLALDTCGRSRTYADCVCTVCSTKYTKQKRLLNEYGTCSGQCTSVVKGNSIFTTCAHCNTFIFKSKSKADKSKSGLLFCSRECKDLAQTYISEIQPEHYGKGSGSASYREKAFRYYKNVCSMCGYSNKNALEVHHKDKNRDNNSIDNLEILCANCHTLTHKGLRTGVQD